MIEIAFSDNTYSKLKCEQKKMNKRKCSTEEADLLFEQDTADIYGFELFLSIGDISEEGFYNQRQKVLEEACGYEKNKAMKLLQDIMDDLNVILERAEMGEKVRVWYSNQPDEMCGLYWFMDQLSRVHNYNGQVHWVKLPEYNVLKDGNLVVEEYGWYDVNPEKLYRYLETEKIVPAVFWSEYASRWRDFQEENAPLRAVLNGRLVSMPETFYDDFMIYQAAGDVSEITLCRWLSGILGIPEHWIRLRIKKLIAERKLR